MRVKDGATRVPLYARPTSFGVLALIVAAGLAGPLLSIGRQAYVPVVVGELFAGVVIGRTGGGWLDASEPTTAFLAAVGFAMLMFGAGMLVPIRAPGIAGGLRRGAAAALLVGILAVPAGIGIAAAVGGGDAAIYCLLVASGSAAVLLPAIQETRLGADTGALVVMSQVAIADVAAIFALPFVMQPDRAREAAVGAVAVACSWRSSGARSGCPSRSSASPRGSSCPCSSWRWAPASTCARSSSTPPTSRSRPSW